MSTKRSIDGSLNTFANAYQQHRYDEGISASEQENVDEGADDTVPAASPFAARPIGETREQTVVPHEDVYRTLLEAEYFFNTLYDTYHVDLYAFILNSTRSVDESNDIMQETFVSVWQHLYQVFDLSERSRRNWLFTTARNKMYDHYRRCKSREKHLMQWRQQALIEQEGQQSPDELAGAHEQLWDILQCLSKRERECLVLISQGWDSSEVASVLGIGASSVRSYMTHVKQKYLKALSEIKQASEADERNS